MRQEQQSVAQHLRQLSAQGAHMMSDAKKSQNQALNKILYHLKLRQHMSQWETSFEKANGLTDVTAAEPQPSAVIALNEMAASALAPVLTPEKPKKDLEVFEVAGTGIPWNDFMERHARHAEDKKWLDIFKDKLREHLNGKDSEVRVNGNLAATVVRDGLFAYKKFTEENPHLADQYTRFVTEKKLDVEALRTDHPALFDNYKATSVRIKN